MMVAESAMANAEVITDTDVSLREGRLIITKDTEFPTIPKRVMMGMRAIYKICAYWNKNMDVVNMEARKL